MPLVDPGHDLATLILNSLKQTGLVLVDGDILVVAQKIISKSEGRAIKLAGVRPSAQAIQLAEATEKEPRLVELITRTWKQTETRSKCCCCRLIRMSRWHGCGIGFGIGHRRRLP